MYLKLLEVHQHTKDKQRTDTQMNRQQIHIYKQNRFPVRHKMNDYSKTCLKRPPSKRPQIGFQDRLWLNYAGQKDCRMLEGEHSAKLSTFIKLPFVIKTFILSIFEWPFYTDFTVLFLIYRHVHLIFYNFLYTIFAIQSMTIID